MVIETSSSWRRWNNREIENLRELYLGSLMEEIMTAIPRRTKKAVQSKAWKLGIKATKEKMSEAHTGEKNHNYGKYFSKETRRKISEANKGRYISEKWRQNISEALTGRLFSEEHRRNLSDNHARYWHGKHLSEEAKRKISDAFKGENHPNWRGGKSFEPYSPEFNGQLKREIRERDNYQCQKCDITREESLEKYHRVLSVHHIDGNKRNNNKSNLVTLCASCNTRLEPWIVRPQFARALTVEEDVE